MKTLEELDEVTVELAKKMYSLTTRDQVKKFTWLPFALLYEQLIRKKLIPRIGELPEEQKRKYWEETEGSRDRRIFVSEALYVYDLISK